MKFFYKLNNYLHSKLKKFIEKHTNVKSSDYYLKHKIESIKPMFNSNSTIANFAYAFREISKNKVDGSIVEIGVAYGTTLSQLIVLNEIFTPDKKIYGFDSFINSHSRNHQNTFMSAKKYMEDFLYKNLENAKVDYKNVNFVEGLIQDTLPETKISQIALLHLDVDLPESYETSLLYLWNKVQVGGYIIFDEYDESEHIKKFGNMKNTIDLFLEDKKFEEIKYSFLNKYIIKKIG
jgi:hypothetical protein